tara:strand:+ start:51 stop:1130 length:1080 start_codon:yes stop_codon:yes gene_type:complete
MKLDLFKKLDDVSEEKLHPKFKHLKDILIGGEKDILVDWTDGFIDRDNKIIKEFQTTFHSSFWEFYLFQIFKDLGFEIDFSRDRPDFIIKSPQNILIEAVVSNIKVEGREEKSRTIDDITSMLMPPHKQTDYYSILDESIVRNSNAIIGKSKKYLEKYTKCEWVSEDFPFVIALSSYDQVNYGREYIYPLMALLYGRYFNPQLDNFEKKDSIIKPGTESEIPVGLFNNDGHKHISAIIFSCTTTLGKLTSLDLSNGNMNQTNAVLNIRNDYEKPFYKIQSVSKDSPEELGDGLMIFHNPKSNAPIDPEIFKKSNAIQFIPTDNEMRIEGENTPIFSRLNIPKFMVNNTLVNLIFKDFNE